MGIRRLTPPQLEADHSIIYFGANKNCASDGEKSAKGWAPASLSALFIRLGDYPNSYGSPAPLELPIVFYCSIALQSLPYLISSAVSDTSSLSRRFSLSRKYSMAENILKCPTGTLIRRESLLSLAIERDDRYPNSFIWWLSCHRVTHCLLAMFIDGLIAVFLR